MINGTVDAARTKSYRRGINQNGNYIFESAAARPLPQPVSLLLRGGNAKVKTPEAFPAAEHLGCRRRGGKVAVVPISRGVAEESDRSGVGFADTRLLQVPGGWWVGVGGGGGRRRLKLIPCATVMRRNSE